MDLDVWVTRFINRQRAEPNSECIRWIGAINTKNHYGHCRVPIKFSTRWSISARTTTGAHRMSYTLVRGPIPEDMHIDHLCDNRWCVNAYHMEAVPQPINSHRANRVRWGWEPTEESVL